MATLKLKKFNPTVGMTDEEVVDYLIDCMAEDWQAGDFLTLPAYARGIEFICEREKSGMAGLAFVSKVNSRLQDLRKAASSVAEETIQTMRFA